jgi:rhamnulose-1-phosphate aldolase/alcohol dehydrogenase
MSATAANGIPNLWNPSEAPSDPLEELVYASRLLGSDLRITNFGGGNTSVKAEERDPLTGAKVEVLWVKGSGGDLGSSTRANYASLYLDRVLALEGKVRDEGLHEDDVVDLYRHCTFNLNPTACSIDTPLHAFVPARCVSHMHADAVIAIAAAKDAEALCQEVWGGEMAVLHWKRPGFELGLQLRDLIAAHPEARGALMLSHGFICWADTWRECYEQTLRMINQAQAFLDGKGRPQPFGPAVRPIAAEDPRGQWLRLLPELRGKVAHERLKLVAQVDDSELVRDFLSRESMERLAAMGTSCPDHFLRTKIRPLVLQGENLDSALEEFRRTYGDYCSRCRHPDSPAMRNPNPSVVLIPGLGMVSFGKNPQEARVTGQFYRNAIEVMRGAEAVSSYTSLPEQEAFDIEYWQLEEAKLRRQPPEKELSRSIALVTGGAQGIGFATAARLLEDGACVAVLDINEEKLDEARRKLEAKNKDAVLALACDVTDGASLQRAVEETVLRWGGLDICIVSAGNARRGTVADTSDADYDFQANLLMRAYFGAMRAASQVMIRQGTGGSIVVVASKNGVAVGSNAAVYSAAKAFELHLMRCTASDLAKHGVRCNAINPDAVIEGSGIWSDAWKEQTAKSLGIGTDELPEYYRKRSMLGRTVSPEDCAEAIAWLASERRSSRTTGCVIPVDGGVREGFLR